MEVKWLGRDSLILLTRSLGMIIQITRKTARVVSIVVSISLSVLAAAAMAQSDPASEKGGDEELVKQLANPVASLISVPFQNNFDFNLGTGHGWRYTLDFQPVVPIKLNDSWTLIVLSIAHQRSAWHHRRNGTGFSLPDCHGRIAWNGQMGELVPRPWCSNNLEAGPWEP
jgi:hypothetical protein